MVYFCIKIYINNKIDIFWNNYLLLDLLLNNYGKPTQPSHLFLRLNT